MTQGILLPPSRSSYGNLKGEGNDLRWGKLKMGIG